MSSYQICYSDKNLLQRQKCFEEKKNFRVNDVALLVEETQQRSKWVMGTARV